MTHRYFLVGMPYAGKSYWGRQIADHYGMTFYDLDVFITEFTGKSISEIFDTVGEPGFREIEHVCLEELINQTSKDCIIACGGGTPCFHNNMTLMKKAGTVVFLEADIPYLVANFSKDTTIRPLLNDPQVLTGKLTELQEERAEYYTQAHYILQVADISITTFDKILNNE